MIEYAVTYRGALIRFAYGEEGQPIPTIPETDFGWSIEVMDQDKFPDQPLDMSGKSYPKAADFVPKDWFFFQLLAPAEYGALQWHLRQIEAQGEWNVPVPTTQTGMAYRGLDTLREQLAMIERVQLTSSDVTNALDLFLALQFWGDPTDPATLTTYATRREWIINARRYDGSYINQGDE